jgi:hypothetical protein
MIQRKNYVKKELMDIMVFIITQYKNTIISQGVPNYPMLSSCQNREGKSLRCNEHILMNRIKMLILINIGIFIYDDMPYIYEFIPGTV